MYAFDSRIRYSETDSEGDLTLDALLNYFQDCSTFHSEDVGLGIGYMKEIGQVWVLSSWQIVVNRYPKLGEKVKIVTLPYELKVFWDTVILPCWMNRENIWRKQLLMESAGCRHRQTGNGERSHA